MKNNFSRLAIAVMIIIAMGSIINISSCKKGNGDFADTTHTQSPVVVTEAIAAELITNAVRPETGGMLIHFNTSLAIKEKAHLNCGARTDTSITNSSAQASLPSYTYGLKGVYVLNCQGLVPSQVEFDFNGTAQYNDVHFSSNDKTDAWFRMNTYVYLHRYTFIMSYIRTGTTTSKNPAVGDIASNIKIIADDNAHTIDIDVPSYQITSGSANVTITGTSRTGADFSFSGTLTFIGNKKAHLVLNSGTNYDIQWVM
jgi:hypothetical protein